MSSGQQTPREDFEAGPRTRPPGMLCLQSRHDARDTMDRLVASVVARDMTVFARIDHSLGAAEAGQSLRPTELLIFGNARAGTPLMQAAQSIGIDLPLKALVWRDASGTAWLGYNDPDWLARRHGAASAAASVVDAMREALAGVAREATGHEE